MVSLSSRTWSYSLSEARKMSEVTFSKQWIHFRRSDFWPPTSTILMAWKENKGRFSTVCTVLKDRNSSRPQYPISKQHWKYNCPHEVLQMSVWALSPQCDGLDSEGVVVDASSGESNSQHVLFCGDIVQGGDSVKIVHVAEAQKSKKVFHRSSLIHFCV